VRAARGRRGVGAESARESARDRVDVSWRSWRVAGVTAGSAAADAETKNINVSAADARARSTVTIATVL